MSDIINICNPEEKKVIFKNAYEPIIDLDIWERVQELRKNKRRPDYFVCSGSRKGKELCSTHFIRAVVLEKGVLEHMRGVIDFVKCFEKQFREVMGEKQKSESKKELKAKRKLLAKSENRIAELDRLFKSIYEDKANGVLSENRFQMLADDYENEQEELRGKAAALADEIAVQEEETDNLERFIAKIHKYFDLQELTPSILNDLVKKVYVYAPEYVDGKRTQQVDIYYDLVGFLPLSLLNKNRL